MWEKSRITVTFFRKWFQILVFIYILQMKHLMLCILKVSLIYGGRFYVQNKAFATYEPIVINFYLMEKSVELLKAAANVDVLIILW